MKTGLRLLFFLILPGSMVGCTYTFYRAQCDYPVTGHVSRVSYLDDELNETSGLGQDEESFITFNDSGGEPAIYRFDGSEILEKTILRNAYNVDWEAIAISNAFIYVADIGNNYGNRDTLVIYKINRKSLRETSAKIAPEKITFSYSDEVGRTESGRYSHDCESIFAYGDSLYLFTKNWTNLSTSVFSLPVEPGHYNISTENYYDVRALITGADIDPANKEVVLSGYRRGYPVLIRYSFDISPSMIRCGGKARKYYKLAGTQVEGVAFGSNGNIYFTSEKRLRKQAIYMAY